MLFQAGSLTVFLLFWQVPDITGQDKIDTVLKQISLLSDKLKERDKLCQDNFTQLKQEVDSLVKHVDQLVQVSPVDQNACLKGLPHINGTKKITLWGNTTTLCDTTTDEGGWVIIQRRINDDVEFYRGWREYRAGFGNLDTGFWIGNTAIHLLSDQGYNELRIELIYQGRRTYAHYSNFYVASEALNFKLTVGAYAGTAGDSLTQHNDRYFSTFDRDNDPSGSNCADVHKGAWWYYNCQYSNLNGIWGVQSNIGVTWYALTGWNSASFTEMKVRRG